MDAFFAAVELKRHPELRGKPLIIGGRGDPHERGVVSTASYEARKFGIHSAMPLRTAYDFCPGAVFLPVDFQAYERESARIKAVLRSFTPLMEDVGIDEAFLDISELPEASTQIARTIKREIFRSTGLSCSIGIAPNKLLAKIASDLDKPDGLTIITEKDIAGGIWPLAARKLPGVGPKTEQSLKALGIETIGDLAKTPIALLMRQFGSVHGKSLHQAAQGIDDSALITHWEPKSSSREVTFQHDIQDTGVLLKTLRELTLDVLQHVRGEGFLCRIVTVKIRFSDFETHTREQTLLRHSDERAVIERTALYCFHRFKFVKKVRLLGIRLGDLRKRNGVQDSTHEDDTHD